MIEVYTKLSKTNPFFMQKYFIRKDVKCDLRTRDSLQMFAAKTLRLALILKNFQGSLLWNSTADLIKRVSPAAIFKKGMGDWDREECNCKICS